MTTGWMILMMIAIGYACFATVAVVLLSFVVLYWYREADELRARLAVAESALNISEDIPRSSYRGNSPNR